MPRILALVPNPYMGGLQIMTLRLLAKRSAQVHYHFLLTRWTDGEFGRRLAAMGVPATSTWFGMFSRKLDRRNVRMTLECLWRLPLLYRDFWRLMRRFNPEGIYFGNYHEIILLLPALWLTRLPVIYHVHSVLPTSRFHRLTFRIWGRRVTRYVAVSGRIAHGLRDLAVDQRRVSLLQNGVDVAEFVGRTTRIDVFATRFGWPSDAIIVGMTGQMMPDKGQRQFIEAASEVYARFPQVRFVIGGKAEYPFYDELRDQIAATGLAQVVVFTGWQEDMPNFYAGLDIFAMPSQSSTEGFGLVTAEAMAVGLPVVATRTGDAAALIEHGRTGFLIDMGSAVQLAEAIERLVSSSSLRRALGKAARERVERAFSLPEQSRQFEALLVEVSKHGS